MYIYIYYVIMYVYVCNYIYCTLNRILHKSGNTASSPMFNMEKCYRTKVSYCVNCVLSCWFPNMFNSFRCWSMGYKDIPADK